MTQSSRKRKASELDAAPDLNGHPTPSKGKRKSKKSGNVCDTAPAPEHGYTVKVGPRNDPNAPILTLWNEIDWDCTYTVQPSHWDEIKSYRNFILPSSKDDPFRIGETVYVARHVSTPAPPVAPSKLDDMPEQSEEYERELAAYGKTLLQYNKENFWLAKILQIRANAPERVLILVAWLYWPYELPKGYQQPWFGDSEVFPSNLLDIIDASTVSDRAKIVYLDERADTNLYDGVEAAFQKELAAARLEQEKTGRKVQADDAPPILFWRQSFDSEAHRSNPKLKYADTTSNLPKFCTCQRPNNPDKRMFQCAHKKCLQWTHDDCIVDGIGAQAAQSLRDEKIDEWAKANAPRESHITLTERVGLGVKAMGKFIANEVEHIAESGIEAIKHETTTELHHESPTNGNGNGNGNDTALPIVTSPASKKRGRPKKESTSPTTWKSKFSISIIADKEKAMEIPPFARITEKHGDKRTWEVKIQCLACGETLD